MTQNSIDNSASSLDVDNINIDGNTISSTDTDGDINLSPDGIGVVSVTNPLDVNNIRLTGNTISSTDTNGDINLSPDGTGTVSVTTSIDIDNIRINGNTIESTDTNGQIILTPDGTAEVNITSSLIAANFNLNANTISATNTNGDITLTPDGTGVITATNSDIVSSNDRINSLGSTTNSWDNVYCDGLTFDDGTNILDTYTEATSFTPTLAFGGASTGITYAVQGGSYTRIGNLIWFTINLNLTSKGTATGSATIEGLPFTANSSTYEGVRLSNVAFTIGKTYAVGVVNNGGTNINLQEVGSGASFLNIQDSAVANNSGFFISGVFRVAT